MAAPRIRSWHHREFPTDALVEAKRGRVISVCIPARNESATIGAIVTILQTDLVEGGLVDEVVVVDDGSSDDTVDVAAEAGATVAAASAIRPEMGPGAGKGEALWKSLHASKGELVAFCDADVTHFGSHLVSGVLGPLLVHDAVDFVKGFYDRPLDGVPNEGGRVTELVARPLIALLFPHLSGFDQPLSGEYAARRELLESVPFVQGYGVDLALLVDIAERFGISSMGQVDLGTRAHRNRPLDELGPQALAVLQTGLLRAGITLHPDRPGQFTRPGLPPVTVDAAERPPVADDRPGPLEGPSGPTERETRGPSVPTERGTQ